MKTSICNIVDNLSVSVCEIRKARAKYNKNILIILLLQKVFFVDRIGEVPWSIGGHRYIVFFLIKKIE